MHFKWVKINHLINNYYPQPQNATVKRLHYIKHTKGAKPQLISDIVLSLECVQTHRYHSYVASNAKQCCGSNLGVVASIFANSAQ